MEVRAQIISKILDENNKIKHKYTVEKYALKYFTKEEYDYIYSVAGKSITERLWRIVHDLKEIPTCPVCHKRLPFKRGWSGYQSYCSNSCTATGREVEPETQAKREATLTERFGTSCIPNSHTPEANAKRKSTVLEKYGSYEHLYGNVNEEKRIESVRTAYAANGKAIQEKKEAACIKKYGCKLGQRESDRFRSAANFNKKVFYLYDSLKFDSAPELYYYIYMKETQNDIRRNTIGFKYYDSAMKKERMFFPDFTVNGKLVEIKGDHFLKEPVYSKLWKDREKICIDNNIQVIYESDVNKSCREYVWEKYSKDYIKQFKISKQHRKVVFIDENTNTFELRNTNIKLAFKCCSCGKEVVTSYSTIIRLAELKCKACRKD